MREFRNGLIAVMLVGLASIVSACFRDAESADGVSQAEFDALVARVAALEANQPGDKVVAGASVHAAAAGSIAKAAAAGGQQLGTAVGFVPADVPPYQSRLFTIKSANGYLYTVPNEPNSNGVVGLGGLGSDGGIVPVYFESADCSGQAYVSLANLSDYGAQQGVVFRLHAGQFNEIVDDPAQYFYVPAGTARTSSIAYQSQMSNIGSCAAASGTLSAGFAALPNDSTVTSVESAPVATPVTLSDPQPAA